MSSSKSRSRVEAGGATVGPGVAGELGEAVGSGVGGSVGGSVGGWVTTGVPVAMGVGEGARVGAGVGAGVGVDASVGGAGVVTPSDGPALEPALGAVDAGGPTDTHAATKNTTAMAALIDFSNVAPPPECNPTQSRGRNATPATIAG
jgi:hypothetical protein